MPAFGDGPCDDLERPPSDESTNREPCAPNASLESHVVEDADRLRVLREYEIVGTPPEDQYDRVARLARSGFEAGIGLVTFVEPERQWHKAAAGTDLAALPRAHSFCAYAIETAGATVIEDLRRHERFADHPHVGAEGEGGSVRFYAGAPITTAEGHRLGTVCVLDEAPQSPSREDVHQLNVLADLVMSMLRARAPGATAQRGEEAFGRASQEEASVERRHRRTRDRLRRTQAVAEVGGWEYDPQTDTFEGTKQLYQLLGLPPDTDLGRDDALAFYPPEARDKVAAASRRCLEAGESFSLEVPFRPKDGGRRWVRTQAEARMDGGEVRRVVGTLQDITAQKRQERILERQNDLFTKAQAMAQVGAWEYDLQTGEQVLTEQVYVIHGLRPEEDLTPEQSISFYHSADRPKIRRAFERAMQEGVPYDLELRLIDDSGRQRWVRTRGEPQLEDGDVVRVRGTLQDVTERKELRETLRRQKELLSSVTDHISEGIFRATWADGIVYANQAFVDMFGYESFDALAETAPTALYANPAEREALYDEQADQEVPGRTEVRLQRQDGSTFVGLVSIRKVEGEFGAPDYYDGAITDITDRRRQKEQLRERQQKVEALYEATSRLLRAQDKNEVADLLVTLIGETLGYSGTTIRFVEGDQLAPSRVPDMVRRYMPERPSYDLEGDTPAAKAHRTGETQVFDDLSAEEPSLERGEIRATAYVPMEKHGLISVGSRDVGGIGPFDLRLIEILGGYAALVLGRLEREKTLRRARDEAEEANRMKATLLANINHEFRTPLTTIISSARLIVDEPERAEQFSEGILAGGQRLLRTLNTVMDFSELEGGQLTLTPQRFDVRELLVAVADDGRARARRNDLSLKVEAPETATAVTLDHHHVKRIGLHLLSNAIKFTEEGGGTIIIGGRRDEEAVTLWVEDPGIGIPPSFQARMFDEFAQASTGNDRTHEGNGLGLTIVKRLVDRMEGTVEVDSAQGEGTRVTVRLPEAEGEATDGRQ